jgi:transposase
MRSLADGFPGAMDRQEVVTIQGERQRIAYMRFETEPGYQSQVDFGEFQFERGDGTIGKIYLFSMILGFSRRLYSEFVDRCDLPTFLDCHIRAFDYFGGVTEEILYDRMKNVFIKKLAGKSKFNDTLMGFALHYGFKPAVAPAYAAWVKGKVERPYHFIREGFWRGYGFICRETANRDLLNWLQFKDQRIHGTTHEVVSERFERERPYLQTLPPGVRRSGGSTVRSTKTVRSVLKATVMPFLYPGGEGSYPASQGRNHEDLRR